MLRRSPILAWFNASPKPAFVMIIWVFRYKFYGFRNSKVARNFRFHMNNSCKATRLVRNIVKEGKSLNMIYLQAQRPKICGCLAW
jgi:hypothetical protein